MMRKIVSLIVILNLLSVLNSYSQGCCSGGGSNPLAGGVASGLLNQGDVEFAFSNVYSHSNTFLVGDSPTTPYYDKTTSNYLFFKVDVGLTNKFTLSTAVGYYTNRTIYEFNDSITNEQRLVTSKGIGDLIILPRYQLFNNSKNGRTNELSLGLGIKLPLGSNNDSTFIGHSYFVNMNNGNQPFLDSIEIWQTSPPLVQATTGSNDFIASLFFMHTTKHNFNFFINSTYIQRGWNSLGMKFGNFASVGLFCGKTFFNQLSVVAQIRGEWIGKMKTHDKIDYLANYNIDTASTGNKSIFFSPQLSYIYKNFRVFALADIPVYQYLNGTQVAVPRQVTAGITYRLTSKQNNKIIATDSNSILLKINNINQSATSFRVWGNCEMCKEKIEKTIKKLKGVYSASWEVNTQILKVDYDKTLTSPDSMKKKLASIGYDSDTHKATEKAYNSLHECCKYKRELN